MSAEPVMPDNMVATAPAPGGLLKAGRERLDLTVHQVASKLNLSPRNIEMMEANQFETLGAPVYIKGYLRQYAQLAGCTDTVIIDAYQQLAGRQTVDPVPVPITHHAIPAPRRPLPGWVLWGVALLIVVAVVAILRNLEPPVQTSSAPTMNYLPNVMPSAQPLQPAQQQPTQSSPLNTFVRGAAEVVAGLESVEAPAPTPVAATATAAPGTVTMALQFKGDSWVEIYDARRQRLMFDMGRSGGARQVSGTAPLQVLLGSASHVHLTINGRAVAIPADRSESDVARFTIDASGDFQ